MSLHRIERLASWFARYAGAFVSERFNFQEGIITVSRVDIEPNLTKATILITVYPEDKEQEVIKKLKTLAWDFRNYVKNFYRMRKLPAFEFELDYGEKNALRVEEVLTKKKAKTAKNKRG